MGTYLCIGDNTLQLRIKLLSSKTLFCCFAVKTKRAPQSINLDSSIGGLCQWNLAFLARTKECGIQLLRQLPWGALFANSAFIV
jgi:hypothetical protein